MRDTTPHPSSNGNVSNRPSDEADITFDEIFEILSNNRRRQVIRYLGDTDEPIAIGTLAEQIAADETEKAVDELTSQERKRVYVGLYQVHLPKMDDMGVISFDTPRGMIEEGPNIDLVREYLPPAAHASDETESHSHLSLLALVLLVTVIALFIFFTLG